MDVIVLLYNSNRDFKSHTMTSADFLTFSHTSLYGLLFQSSFPQLIVKTSPGKNAILLSIYLPHLHTLSLSSFRASTCLAALPTKYALYVISVRQTRDLPTDFLQIRPHGRHPCLRLYTFHY